MRGNSGKLPSSFDGDVSVVKGKVVRILGGLQVFMVFIGGA